jgi:hypothetical protein
LATVNGSCLATYALITVNIPSRLLESAAEEPGALCVVAYKSPCPMPVFTPTITTRVFAKSFINQDCGRYFDF